MDQPGFEVREFPPSTKKLEFVDTVGENQAAVCCSGIVGIVYATLCPAGRPGKGCRILSQELQMKSDAREAE